MHNWVNLILKFDHFSYKSRTSGAQVETGGLRKTMTSRRPGQVDRDIYTGLDRISTYYQSVNMSNVEHHIPTSSSGPQLNKRSCSRCSQRKVRCDKVYPCSACVKAEVQCIFPGPKRARRTLNRPPVSELLTRLKLLEEEVRQLRHNPDTDHTPESDDHPNLPKTAKKTELLVLKEGKSRYVSDEASVVLGQKVG